MHTSKVAIREAKCSHRRHKRGERQDLRPAVRQHPPPPKHMPSTRRPSSARASIAHPYMSTSHNIKPLTRHRAPQSSRLIHRHARWAEIHTKRIWQGQQGFRAAWLEMAPKGLTAELLVNVQLVKDAVPLLYTAPPCHTPSIHSWPAQYITATCMISTACSECRKDATKNTVGQ